MIDKYLSLVKFSHTIFAMPFAMLGFVMGVYASEGAFSYKILALVILCMVFARNAAMAFNRWADRDIDGKNPRTAVREIPAGVLSSSSVLWFVIANSIAFVITTYFINGLCFALSPVALAVVLGYSWTKRYTALCHIVLGLGLALAPVGAYLAVTGVFALSPVLLGLAILFWVSGFDIIYALQDADFDREHALYSIPATFGKQRALMISRVLHFLCAGVLLTATYFLGDHTGILSWIGAGIFVGLLIYQHSLVSPDDLSRVNIAFFTTNGLASIIYGVLAIIDFFV